MGIEGMDDESRKARKQLTLILFFAALFITITAITLGLKADKHYKETAQIQLDRCSILGGTLIDERICIKSESLLFIDKK